MSGLQDDCVCAAGNGVYEREKVEASIVELMLDNERKSAGNGW
jgi:hypothetical protein